MTLSDLEWPFHILRAISAVAELFIDMTSITFVFCLSTTDLQGVAGVVTFLKICGRGRPVF